MRKVVLDILYKHQVEMLKRGDVKKCLRDVADLAYDLLMYPYRKD